MFKRSDRFSFKNKLPKQKYINPLFVLRFERSNLPVYGVIASKQVSKKAVHRNRAKRIFFESLQEVLVKNPNSYTLVFFLKRPYTEYSKSVIINELETVFSKLKAIN